MYSTLLPPFFWLLLAWANRLYEVPLLDGLFTALASNSPGLALALFVAVGCPSIAVVQGLRDQSRLRALFYIACGLGLIAANLAAHMD